MSQQQLDARGEAHDALSTAVSSYGQRVLNDPRILGNLVTDLLPDLPRERSLLVTGAEAGVAAEVTQHVEQEHIDPDMAVQLAARSLSESRSIDPAASMWVASEYAQALGYQVRPFAQPSWPGEPETAPPAPPTMPGADRQPMATQPPPTAPVSPQVPRQVPPAQSWPAQPPSPQPPPGGPPPQPPGPPPAASRSKRGPIIAAVAVVGAIGLYLIIAAVVHTFPFAKSHPPPVAKPPTPPTRTHTTPAPTPSPVLAAGVTPLAQLLPSDIADPTTQCSAIKPQWGSPGLVASLSCNDTDLPNGFVNGYQMDNRTDFDTAWRNFNSFIPFDSSTAQSLCPPSGSGGQAIHTWDSKFFPTMPGQVLECFAETNAAPVYAWSLPTEDTFFIAQGANGSSFTALNTWWENNSGPANAPTATPSPQKS
jgi:hypothetical protein